MNIRLLDSWIREYLKTDATHKDFAKAMSLASVSIERTEKVGEDYLYDIEVTTNRPDLMSVIGIAREAGAVLPQYGQKATFSPPKLAKPKTVTSIPEIKIINQTKKVKRILGVVMDVTLKQSPEKIQKRLEGSDIRSLNNVIDVTNYVMREIGHPAHAFDYDRLTSKKFVIREAKKGEHVETLDGKKYTLPGGDIVADDGTGKIVDLLGIMGTANSVVTDQTKRILFFIDNNDKHQIRKTSMGLGIRSEAAVLNEKGVDPELAMDTLLRGIELYEEIADGKVVSEILDIYDDEYNPITVSVAFQKINDVIGIEIPEKTSVQILEDLGFQVKTTGGKLTATVPSWRAGDIEIPEDLVEEIARIYGYHKIPNALPPFGEIVVHPYGEDQFFWSRQIKSTLRDWGFVETFTYSFVSEDLLEGEPEEAVRLANPLTTDMEYMRTTLVPSLLEVVRNHGQRESLKLFEISKVYKKKEGSLPDEVTKLAGIIKQPKNAFSVVKGFVEQILVSSGIPSATFKKTSRGVEGADIFIDKDFLGTIEILDKELINFELEFSVILKHATLAKTYQPVTKFPPVIEDVRLAINPGITYEEIVKHIQKQNKLIKRVELIDVFENKKTFRITYQAADQNLTNEEVGKIRDALYESLEKEFHAKIG